MPDAILTDLITEFYDELNALAKRMLRAERPGHELESNDLVHECYLRLRRADIDWRHAPFLNIAASAMRSILIDFARYKQANKRASGAIPERQQVAYKEPFYEEAFDLQLSIDRTLAEFKARSPRDAQVLELRMEGFTWEEIATSLDLPFPPSPKYWPYWRYKLYEHRVLGELLESHLGFVAPRHWPLYPWPWWPKAQPNQWLVAAARLRAQLGISINWVAMMREIQDRIVRRSDRALYLSDLERIAATVPCSPDHILLALAHLTRPPLAVLRMELRSGSEKGPQVNTEKMVSTMKNWHRSKTLSNQEWQEWISSVWVIWTEQAVGRDAR